MIQEVARRLYQDLGIGATVPLSILKEKSGLKSSDITRDLRDKLKLCSAVLIVYKDGSAYQIHRQIIEYLKVTPQRRKDLPPPTIDLCRPSNSSIEFGLPASVTEHICNADRLTDCVLSFAQDLRASHTIEPSSNLRTRQQSFERRPGADSADVARRAQSKLSVFLCHAQEDKRQLRDLYHSLKADGFAPWLDEEDLLPGLKWRSEIEIAIQDSDVFLVCLTQTSVNKTGEVQRELKIALDVAQKLPHEQIYVIPVRLEECPVPNQLRELQYADLFSERGYEKLVRSLDLCSVATERYT